MRFLRRTLVLAWAWLPLWGCGSHSASGTPTNGSTPDGSGNQTTGGSTSTAPNFMLRGHSHNDFAEPQPLSLALSLGFHSIEADVLVDAQGQVRVAHNAGSPELGTLKDMYLDPLVAKIAAHPGSVFGDGLPFYLWLDLKEDAALGPKVAEVLAQYSDVTQFGPGASGGTRAITVILSGNGSAKTAFFSLPAPWRALRDGPAYLATDGAADGIWLYDTLQWSTYITDPWTGNNPAPAGVQQTLKALVDAVHTQGRGIRFWGMPDTKYAWKVELDTGVDFISTDRLDDLHAFLVEETQAAQHP